MSADSVRLAWSDGLHGVQMRLGRVEGGLDGHAEIITDVRPVRRLPDGSLRPLPLPVAKVQLRRANCQRALKRGD